MHFFGTLGLITFVALCNAVWCQNPASFIKDFETVKIRVHDWNPSLFPLPHCEDGQLGAIAQILGLDLSKILTSESARRRLQSLENTEHEEEIYWKQSLLQSPPLSQSSNSESCPAEPAEAQIRRRLGFVYKPFQKKEPDNFSQFFESIMSTQVKKLLVSETASRIIDALTGPGTSSYEFQVYAKEQNMVDVMCDVLSQDYEDILPNKCRVIKVIEAALGCQVGEASETYLDSCANEEDYDVWLPPIEQNPEQNVKTSLDVFEQTCLNHALEKNSNFTSIGNEESELGSLKCFFFLFRATELSKLFADRSKICGRGLIVPDLIPGWRTDLILELEEEGNLSSSTPFGFMLRSRKMDSGKQNKTILVLRPTITSFEWKMNLMSDFASLPRGGSAHKGILNVAMAVYHPVLRYLNKMLKSDAVELTIVGHSLGAAAGQILALLLDDVPNLILKGVFFGSPNVLNRVAIQRFNKLNARIFNVDQDGIRFLPCLGRKYALLRHKCYSAEAGISSGNDESFLEDERYPDDNQAITLIPFKDISKELKFEKMWFSGSLGWLGNVTLKYWFPGIAQIAVAHTCAYQCYFSKIWNSEGPGWNCNSCKHTFQGGSLKI